MTIVEYVNGLNFLKRKARTKPKKKIMFGWFVNLVHRFEYLKSFSSSNLLFCIGKIVTKRKYITLLFESEYFGSIFFFCTNTEYIDTALRTRLIQEIGWFVDLVHRFEYQKLFSYFVLEKQLQKNILRCSSKVNILVQ